MQNSVMSRATTRQFRHLSAGAGRMGQLAMRPRAVAAACVVVLTGLGWVYLALLAAQAATDTNSTGTWFGFVQALCLSMPENSWQASNVALGASMWCAMTLAMMLPSTAPMILTYADIAETAAHKGEMIVSPLVLTAGYGVVWIVFSFAAALLQGLLVELARVVPGVVSARTLFAGAIFIGAGLYQFSNLKNACLTRCRQPFPFFFTNWATTRGGVLVLGLRQGLYCLGCCWAMMLVMFVVGAMNIAWMAGLAVIATLEKMLTGRFFTQLIGIALIAGGAIIVLESLYSHWPG